MLNINYEHTGQYLHNAFNVEMFWNYKSSYRADVDSVQKPKKIPKLICEIILGLLVDFTTTYPYEP